MRWIVLILALIVVPAAAETRSDPPACTTSDDMTEAEILSCDVANAAGQTRFWIYLRRMGILNRRADYVAALTAADHLLNLAPDNGIGLSFRARMLMVLGRHDEGLVTANRVLEQDLGRSSRTLDSTRLVRATLRARTGDHVGALRDIVALTDNPDISQALLQSLRARYLAFLGRDTDARKALTVLFAHQAPSAQAKRIAVQAYLLLGAKDSAADIARTIVPVGDTKMDHLAAVGLIACQTGQPEPAFEALHAAADEARWFQLIQAVILREAGHVSSPIPALSRADQAIALRAWIADGCPAPY